MKINILWTLMLSICLCACNNSVNKYEKEIIGNWQAVSWVSGSGQTIQSTQNVSFSFDSTGKYNYINLKLEEEGTYKIENDMLFTKPTNQNEMMVKIIKITTDSLVFGMNRGGNDEVITLLKK